MLKKSKFLLLIVFIFGSFSAFSSSQVKVGVSPVLSSAAVFIAMERGYFKKLGIEKVDLIIFKNSGAPMTALLAKGELDVGAGNLSSGLYNAINEGVKIKIVADKGHVGKSSNYIGLLVRSDLVTSKQYKTPKDLKGLKFGVTSETGVSQQILLDRILKKHNLNIGDITFVKMSYSEMNIALQNRSIDAAIQLEPYLTMAELSKFAVKVESGYEYYPEQQSAAIFMAPSVTTENRELGVNFLAAYILGIKDYNDAFLGGIKKDEIIQMLKKYINIEDINVWNKIIPVGLTKDGSLYESSVASDLAWYYDNKYIQKLPTVDQVVDSKILAEAKKKLESLK